MTNIGIALPHDPAYATVSRFAQETYWERLSAAIPAKPDLFAYAATEHGICGCFGLYERRPDRPLLFETYIPNAFARIAAGDTYADPCSLAELGTRAVIVPPDSSIKSGSISLALTAALVVEASMRGMRYLGFTANRSVLLIARALGFTLTELGEPDLSSKDEQFRANWEQFFKAKQYCYGTHIASLEGCYRTFDDLAQTGIVAQQMLLRSA